MPGGATLTVQATGDVWSYPDLAGHLVATANSTSARQGPPVTYDPWGAEYPARPPIDNVPGNADFGAFGAASKLEEHAIPTPVILMGARPYSPTEARFLSVDPIQGGCANAYTYVYGDPVNTNDLSGRAVEQCPRLLRKTAGFLGYRNLLTAGDRFRRGDFNGTVQALIGSGPTYAQAAQVSAWAAVAKQATGWLGRLTKIVSKGITGAFLFPVGVAATLVDYACDLDQAG